jgi:hypothetical protein
VTAHLLAGLSYPMKQPQQFARCIRSAVEPTRGSAGVVCACGQRAQAPHHQQVTSPSSPGHLRSHVHQNAIVVANDRNPSDRKKDPRGKGVRSPLPLRAAAAVRCDQDHIAMSLRRKTHPGISAAVASSRTAKTIAFFILRRARRRFPFDAELSRPVWVVDGGNTAMERSLPWPSSLALDSDRGDERCASKRAPPASPSESSARAA